jgi:hypothetical protein
VIALIAAEVSKTPFYIAGSLLAAFAVLLSALGLRRADFPATAAQERLVVLVCLIFVAAAMSCAVISA